MRDVLAVDRDAAALETLHGVAGVARRVADLEQAPGRLPAKRSTRSSSPTICTARFFPLLAALTGGALLYETFAVGNERTAVRRIPEFLLREGELLDVVRGRLIVVAFEQGRIDGARPAVVQRLAAVGPKPLGPRQPLKTMLPICSA